MEIDNDSKEKLMRLPLVSRKLSEYFIDFADGIVNGKFNDDEIVTTMGTLNQNANSRYCDEDLMNYDKAGMALGFGCNRSGLKRLLDRYNIKQVIINNMRCGFRRSEIMALRDKVQEDVRKRELKERRKYERFLAERKKRQERYFKSLGK